MIGVVRIAKVAGSCCPHLSTWTLAVDKEKSAFLIEDPAKMMKNNSWPAFLLEKTDADLSHHQDASHLSSWFEFLVKIQKTLKRSCCVASWLSGVLLLQC